MKIGDLVKAPSYHLDCAEVVGEYGSGFLIRPLVGTWLGIFWSNSDQKGIYKFRSSLLSMVGHPKLDAICDFIRSKK